MIMIIGKKYSCFSTIVNQLFISNTIDVSEVEQMLKDVYGKKYESNKDAVK